MIPWLADLPIFPPVKQALREPNGLLAAGGYLSPEWILAAYSNGIFPWFSDGDPILWWSPDPRMVVFPEELKVTRSLKKVLRSGRFQVRCDTAFMDVMMACAEPRHEGAGTWITKEVLDAYCRLHALGWAHSVETWVDGELVGGLYGLAMGRVFFGESMFHRVTDASKVAFVHLATALAKQDFAVIDCQMSTSHLASLGGREIARDDFVAGLATWTREKVQVGPWPSDWIATGSTP